MRIAICLSGQPRTPEIGFKFIKKYLIDPNKEHQIDFFLHAWYDEKEIGKAWDSAQPYPEGKNGYIKTGTDKFLLNSYKPLKYIIEHQKDFSNHTISFNSHFSAKQNILASFFYSMNKSSELKKEYEKENNFKYDMVIRTRYDLAYMKPVDFSQFKPNLDKIIVPAKFQTDQDNFNNKNKPMVDIFAASTSENMDIFCDIYNNMKMLNKKIEPPFAENYFGQWVRVENNKQLHLHDIEVQILHRMINSGDF